MGRAILCPFKQVKTILGCYTNTSLAGETLNGKFGLRTLGSVSLHRANAGHRTGSDTLVSIRQRDSMSFNQSCMIDFPIQNFPGQP